MHSQIRDNPPEGRIIYFYVVDSDDKLRGVVPTRRMMLNPLDKTVSEIMVRDVVAIPSTASVLDACEFFVLHRFLAFPVVNLEQRLIGTVDVDLYTDEMSELATGRNEDLFQLIGVHIEAARQASPWAAFRGRFPWLICNIVGGILAALLSGLFEAELQQVVALALFIPVVLALAESVSVQSVSLALQMLHAMPPSWSTLARKVRRESYIGLMLGAGSGLAVAVVALAWLHQVSVMVCVLIGIAGGVTGAAVFGITTPNLLRLSGLDPRIAAGPVALTLSDILTLLLYFSTARWLLR